MRSLPLQTHSSGLSDYINRTKRTKQTDQKQLVRPSDFPLGERTDGSIYPLDISPRAFIEKPVVLHFLNSNPHYL